MSRRGVARSVLAALCGLGLSSCGLRPEEFMREPALSPIGSGLPVGGVAERAAQFGADGAVRRFPTNATSLYTDKRISQVGDILTVVIAINDKATFGNSTDRTQSAKTGFSADWAFNGGGATSSSPATVTSDVSSNSTSAGKGNIDRSEQIQLSVAAVVTEVLPNGSLVINGSQEVRVNFEMRQLTVAGIVRPSDIARNNTITYDHIAEARISYGGRGRLTDVQQPAWGHQIYDSVKPF